MQLVVANARTPEEIFDFLAAGAQVFLVTPLRPTDLLTREWRLWAGAGGSSQGGFNSLKGEARFRGKRRTPGEDLEEEHESIREL